MKKLLMTLAAVFCCALTTNAQVDAKYCMTYDDFLDNRWVPVDSLVGDSIKKVIQLRFSDNQYRLKTGDKEADAVLKKSVLLVEYAGHLYANCHNLRDKGAVLCQNTYAQAYRYGENKILVVAYWISGTAVAVGLAADVAVIASPLKVAIPAFAASEAVWLGMSQLNNFRCYLIDSEASNKGKTAVTRLDDAFMENLLADDQELLGRYKAETKKGRRISAANILPVLMEKGLIKE